MQWLVNRFEAFKSEVHKKVDEAIAKWAEGQLADAEEFRKLRGEITALKARMGKKTGNGATQNDGS